jgi:opacity protein-like surface antigen
MRNHKIKILALTMLASALLAPAAQSQIVTSNRVLVINAAAWGRNGQGADVTNRVRSMVRNNSLNFKVSNSNLGGDPNKGTQKTLKISYTYRGRRENRVYNEGDRCRIP